MSGQNGIILFLALGQKVVLLLQLCSSTLIGPFAFAFARSWLSKLLNRLLRRRYPLGENSPSRQMTRKSAKVKNKNHILESPLSEDS